MRMIDRFVSGVARRVGTWPLMAVGPRYRAEVLENVSDAMIHVTPVPGGKIEFFAPTPLLQWRADSVLSKEPDTIRWIDGFEEGAVFWDIGANVGVFSLYAAIRRPVTVLSFEPSAANFYVLTRNIQLNGLCDRVTAYAVALSARTELNSLNLASPSLGMALSQFGNPGEHSPWTGVEEKSANHGAIGFSIDDFVEQFNPPFPAHVKIDVDGLELPILEGARGLLRDPRLKSLLVELNLTDPEEGGRALSLFEEAGLRLASTGEIQETSKARWANHLFRRPEGTSAVSGNRSAVV
jgi:FkbM family methyltransferase